MSIAEHQAARIGELERELEAERERAEANWTSLERVKGKFEDSSAAAAAWKSAADAALIHIQDLHDNLEAADTERHVLRRWGAVLRWKLDREVQGSERLIEAAGDTLGELTQRAESAEQQLAEERERADANWTSLERVKGKLSEKHNELKSAEQQLAERDAELEHLKESFKALDTRRYNAEVELSKLQRAVDRIASLELDASNLKGELERARAQIGRLRTAAEPFARYIKARLGIFSEFSRNAYPELLIAGGGSDLRKEDWRALDAALTGEG